MDLLIVSDTHGDISLIEQYIQDNSQIDGIIHLGDYYHDGKMIQQLLNKPIYQVRGNCDPRGEGEDELIIEFEGTKIFICHGHKYHVKRGLTSLYYRGLEVGADIILFGHSHQRVFVKNEGIVFINPGSASQPRDNYSPNIGVLTIGEEKMIRYSTIY